MAGESDSDFSDEEQSPLDIAFNTASSHIRKITDKLDETSLLEIYGLYKQATEGPCNIPRPGFFNIQGKRKWDAWNSVGELPQEQAKKDYIALVKRLDPEFGAQSEIKTKSESWAAVSSMQHTPEPVLKTFEMSILEAARDNCADRVKELLAQNPKLRYESDADGLTALHWAADRGAVEALAAAIKGGCAVDAVDSSGQTALHYAASCGHLSSAEMLLSAGASPAARDGDGCTPLDLSSDPDVTSLLKAATANS